MSDASAVKRNDDFEGLDARETQTKLQNTLRASAEDVSAEDARGDDMSGVSGHEADRSDPVDDQPDETEIETETGADIAAAFEEGEPTVDDANDDPNDDPSGYQSDEQDDDNEAHGGAPSLADVSDAVWTAAQMAEHLRMLEALLFASPEPLDKAGLARRLPEGADIPALIEAVEQLYENRGVVLSKAGGRYRFVTSPDVAHVLEIEKTEARKLSRAALETLAIIAYHQPCTRADIEDVRGVAVSKGSLDQLMEIGWVRLRGRRRDAPGRPVLYGTTAAFLENFNLETVADLPGMADLKAAGLLDARLPPGFTVPSPSDAGDGEDDTGDAGEDGDAEFVRDFHESDENPDYDASDETFDRDDPDATDA